MDNSPGQGVVGKHRPQRTWRFPVLAVLGGSVVLACKPGAAKDPVAPPGPPVAIAAVSATNQSGFVSLAVANRPSVKVTDQDGTGVPGVTVTFQVTGGGGSPASENQTTNSSGVATVSSWTLGASPGANTMTAAASGLTGSPVTFNATGGAVISAFNITLTFLTNVTDAGQLDAFQQAKTKWEQAITGDIPDWNLNSGPIPAGTCDVLQPARTSGSIDDVEIMVVLDSIDGPLQILGQAGPCVSRPSNRQTIIGVMVFDTADIRLIQNQGKLVSTITHEMAHVLGFGTHWEGAPFNLLVGGGGQTPTYVGTNAVAAFDQLNGGGTSTSVPVEGAAAGRGTADSHWRESVFGRELMTGFLSGTSQPMSATTIRQFEDLGYQVDVGVADPFDIASPNIRVTAETPGLRLISDILNRPRYTFGPSGLVPLPSPH
jgi:hypothetical protein